MTLIDAIYLLASALAVARWPAGVPLLPILVIGAAVASAYLEGWRAPLIPAYAVSIGLVLGALLPATRMQPWVHWLGLSVGFLLLLASLTACIVLPLLKFPPVSGPYAVGTVPVPPELIERFAPTWTKPEPRPAPQARLWYPTAPSAPQSWLAREFQRRAREPAAEGAPLSAVPAQFPVLVYFAGWPGTQIQNFVLIRELVSRGFVVVTLIYPGKLPSISQADFARQVAEYQSPWDYSTQSGVERMRRMFDDRVARGAEDASAMLDLLEAVNEHGALPQFRGRLDLDKAGIFGFSMGGGTSAQAGWREPRFKAVANLDGWHWFESLQQGVPRPYLYMSEVLAMPTPDELQSSNLDTRSMAERHRTEFVSVLRNFERSGGIQVTVTGAGHSNFTDVNLYSPLRRLRQGGSIDRFQALKIVNAFVCGFFERELQGKSEPLLDGHSALYPEVTVKVWPRPTELPAASGSSAPPR